MPFANGLRDPARSIRDLRGAYRRRRAWPSIGAHDIVRARCAIAVARLGAPSAHPPEFAALGVNEISAGDGRKSPIVAVSTTTIDAWKGTMSACVGSVSQSWRPQSSG